MDSEPKFTTRADAKSLQIESSRTEICVCGFIANIQKLYIFIESQRYKYVDLKKKMSQIKTSK